VLPRSRRRLQGGQQAVVVALVQADGGLVEDVHDAGEARADLAGQADTLRLAAGEGVGGTIQRQIVEADIVQEGQARADFLDDLFRHLGALALQGEAVEERQRLTDGQARQGVQGLAADGDVARLDAQTRAFALGAGLGGDVFRQVLAHQLRFAFLVTPLQRRQDAIEGVLPGDPPTALADVVEGDGLAAAAVQNDLLDGLGQLLVGRIDVEAVVHGQRFEHAVEKGVAPVPALHRAGGQRQVREGDDALRVEEGDLTQAVAPRAGAHRVVEREDARLQLRQGVIAHRTGKLGREQGLGAALHIDGNGLAVGMAQRRLEGFGEALLDLGAHLQTIHHRLDGVLLVLFQFG
jgi:hypothetical protein